MTYREAIVEKDESRKSYSAIIEPKSGRIWISDFTIIIGLIVVDVALSVISFVLDWLSQTYNMAFALGIHHYSYAFFPEIAAVAITSLLIYIVSKRWILAYAFIGICLIIFYGEMVFGWGYVFWYAVANLGAHI